MVVHNRPKILFILHLPPPMHGAAVMGQYLYNSEFIRVNYECRYINFSTSKTINEFGKRNMNKLITLFKLLFLVIKERLLFNPDLCYLTINAGGSAFYKDMLFVVLLKLLNSKLVYHFHNKGVTIRQHYYIDNILYEIAFKNSFCILLSPLLYPDIQKYVPPERVAFCANGIPDCNYKSTSINENDHCRLLFLSNMMKEKGVYVLLDACSILKRRNHQFTCHFVGQWSDISEDIFNEKIKELNLSSYVHAFGGQYGKDKEKFLTNADIFIFPTYYHKETSGLVNLEAMQHALPVISTREGGIPDIVEDGVTGYLVNKMDPKDLADKIEILILQPSLRQKMGIAGRNKYENNYTLPTWEKNLSNIINQIIIESRH